MIFLILVLLICVLCVIAIYKIGTKNEKYFENRKIKYIPPKFLFGNTKDLILSRKPVCEVAAELYNVFPDEKLVGVFDSRTPAVLIRDPELIKRLLVKEFEHFQDHKFFIEDSMDLLFGNSLFLMRGEVWRDMRNTLSPVFTGSKMRQMLDLMAGVAERSAGFVEQTLKPGEILEVEMKEFCSRITADVMTVCSFGIEVNSFKEPDNEFFRAGVCISEFGGPFIWLKIVIHRLFPFLYRKFNLSVFDNKLMEFFRKMVFETFEYRSKNNISRPDMIQALLELRQAQESHLGNGEKNARIWDDNQLLSQSFNFLLAGFDTTSLVLSFTCYELARHVDIQNRVYEEATELKRSLNGRKFSYEDLKSLKYLNNVLQEMLRLRPPVPMLERLCVNDLAFKDDDMGVEYTFEKGHSIWMPAMAMHMDPKYFPNPEKVDPERFNDENKSDIDAGTFLPFGLGSRGCLGSRFAMQAAKTVFYHMILNFEFVVIERTQIPLKMTPNLIGLKAEKGVWLGLKRRNERAESVS